MELGLKATDSLLVLVSNLQAYAGNLPMHPVPVQVNELLDIVQLRSGVPPNQSLHFTAPEHAAEVVVDKLMLGRAVQELIKNAVESGNEGGELHLRVVTDATHCRIRLVDSGTGFRNVPTSSAAVPFVTTDPISHGGLGLSFVYGVTERHGGTLRIEDSEEGGSIVSILLPLIPR